MNGWMSFGICSGFAYSAVAGAVGPASSRAAAASSVASVIADGGFSAASRRTWRSSSCANRWTSSCGIPLMLLIDCERGKKENGM